MSTALTRRRALLGSAAAVIGIGSPAAVASAKAASAISPEAKALQAELARLSCEYRTACREADEASQRVDYPDPPEALYVRPGDRRLFARQPEPSWSDKADGRDWWADHETVERLRVDSFAYLSGQKDVQACARRDEVVAAADAWRAADQAAEDAAGWTAAQERFDAASTAYAEFRARLVEMRTDDPEVLTVKALVIVDRCGRSADRLDALIAQAMKRECGADETSLALSMVRDLLSRIGHSVWVSA